MTALCILDCLNLCVVMYRIEQYVLKPEGWVVRARDLRSEHEARRQAHIFEPWGVKTRIVIEHTGEELPR